MWQKIGLFGLLLLVLFIYVQLSKIRINGRLLIPLKYRILTAVFFPVLFGVLFLVGAVLLAIVLAAVLVFAVLTMIHKRKVK